MARVYRDTRVRLLGGSFPRWFPLIDRLATSLAFGWTFCFYFSIFGVWLNLIKFLNWLRVNCSSICPVFSSEANIEIYSPYGSTKIRIYNLVDRLLISERRTRIEPYRSLNCNWKQPNGHVRPWNLPPRSRYRYSCHPRCIEWICLRYGSDCCGARNGRAVRSNSQQCCRTNRIQDRNKICRTRARKGSRLVVRQACNLWRIVTHVLQQ